MNTISKDFSSDWLAEFRAGSIACIPTVLGYLSIGFSAGALARVSGISASEVGLLSLILYAGSGQFIVAGMVQAKAAAITVWLAIFFVNLRHLLLAAYLAPFFKNFGTIKNFLIGAQLTDETFGVASVAVNENEGVSFPWMLGLNLTAYINWLIGNVAGALMATLIPASFLRSLNFALVAMFIGLIVLQISGAKNKRLQVIVAVLSMSLVGPFAILLGSNLSVVLTAIVTSFIGMGVMQWKSDTKSS